MVSSQRIDPVNVQPDRKLEIFVSLWHGCPCCFPLLSRRLCHLLSSPHAHNVPPSRRFLLLFKKKKKKVALLLCCCISCVCDDQGQLRSVGVAGCPVLRRAPKWPCRNPAGGNVMEKEWWAVFFFSPSFPLWWCFAVFRGNAFSPRGGTPCPLTLEWGGRGMLDDDPGFSGLLGAFTTCLHVWCLCPCGSHDCSSGSFWAVNGIQPRGEGKGVAAAGRREQLLLQTCRTTDILLWCDLWVVIGSLTRSRPLN